MFLGLLVFSLPKGDGYMKRFSVLLVLAILVLAGMFSVKKAHASSYGSGESKQFEFNIEDAAIYINLGKGEVMHFGFAKEQKGGAKENPKKNVYQIGEKVYKVSSIVSIPSYENLGWYDMSYLKGKDFTIAYGVNYSVNTPYFSEVIHIRPGDKKFKVFYRGAQYKDNDEVKISRSVFTGAQVNRVMVGTPDTGYFYFVGEIKDADGDEPDVQLLYGADVIYRREAALSGGDYAFALEGEMRHMQLNGSTLIFQKIRDKDSWYSKEIKVKYQRQLSAPTAKVNEKKEIISLSPKLEYRIFIDGIEESGWISVKDEHPDIKGQQLSYYDLIAKKTADGKKTLLTKDMIKAYNVTIEVRAAAKAKTQPSKSKLLEITLPVEEETEETGQKTNQ